MGKGDFFLPQPDFLKLQDLLNQAEQVVSQPHIDKTSEIRGLQIRILELLDYTSRHQKVSLSKLKP